MQGQLMESYDPPATVVVRLELDTAIAAGRVVGCSWRPRIARRGTSPDRLCERAAEQPDADGHGRDPRCVR
jgi:hypothetical protein